MGTLPALQGCGEDESESAEGRGATVHTVLGNGPSDLYLRIADRLGLGATRNIRIVGDAALDQIRIPDSAPAGQVPEWEPSSAIPASFGGVDETKSSRAANVAVGFGLAAGSIYLCRSLARRKQP